MSIEVFFLGLSWILMFLIVWFQTDVFVHYFQLFKLFEKQRIEYAIFVKENPSLFFPDFLYKLSIKAENRLLKFILKLVSCPFCINFWFCVATNVLCSSTLITIPLFYVTSIIIFFILRKFLF
jgi:hypothetical protein